MNIKIAIISLTFTLIFGLSNLSSQENDNSGLSFVYVENTIKFSEVEKDLIQKIIVESEKEIRTLLPELPESIKVILEIMPRNIDQVGGTTGRAEKHNPEGEVYVYISSLYPNGVIGAVEASLAYTIYHEFHHLARGWTMLGNKFEQGIDIAMVNEGLAVVFAEIYTKQILEGNSVPQGVEEWVDEVLELPKDANYNKWMNQHPDGRMGIGYRSGNFVIREAMKNSGKSILELSRITPTEILELAKY